MDDEHLTPNLTALQQASVPVMEREKFASLVGVTVGVVNAWIDKGYLPTFPIGRYSLVNIALLNKLALDKEFRL
ncbi:MAG: hypothetical protein HZB71_08920 [Betaproteobacteria bacterium]|nr:hypothetical protein [Betaproteobacteria bacterium]